jgi:hypothetical protein
MKKLTIYCKSIKYYKVLDSLPSFIKPLGLGPASYPENWLDEKDNVNITELNQFYAEFTGLYWIWKNKLRFMSKDDLIGNCHYRVLWLNELYVKKQKFSPSSLFSKLLKNNNEILNESEVIQVQPISFRNKNLLTDFIQVHKVNALEDCLSFLNESIKKDFLIHLNEFKLYPHNMFITNVKFFEEYCEVIFPWLQKCMKYCEEKKICVGYNSRIPAFLAERFTSFWFNTFKKRSLLSYARLGGFHLSNTYNSFVNTMKLPFTFSQYPTIHKF